MKATAAIATSLERKVMYGDEMRCVCFERSQDCKEKSRTFSTVRRAQYYREDGEFLN